MGNKCFYGMQNLLRSKFIIKDTGCKIYKNIFIKPVVLYGSESWIFTKLNEDNMKIFEKKKTISMAQAV
jgi:hypothetical protein